MSEFLEAVPEAGARDGVAMTLPPLSRMRFEVWALAWPVILSFGLDSILGLSSMLMVGRLGADAVGAVGLATQILGAVRAGIAAVGTGTVALVARYIGASDRASAEDVLRQSVVFGVLVSTIIAIPVIIFARPLMGLFQVHGAMADMGARYLQVVMLSEPFQGIFLMCASALRGAGEIAAFFIGVRILALSFLPGFGFSAASATLVGQGLGAGDAKFSRVAGWEATRMSIVLMTAMGLLFIVFAHWIAALFIDDKTVIAYTVQFMYALAAAQPLMAIDWTITGALRGAGDSRFPLYGSLAGFYGMRLFLTILIWYHGGSINYIWWSLLADYVVRSTEKAWRFQTGKWETIEV